MYGGYGAGGYGGGAPPPAGGYGGGAPPPAGVYGGGAPPPSGGYGGSYPPAGGGNYGGYGSPAPPAGGGGYGMAPSAGGYGMPPAPMGGFGGGGFNEDYRKPFHKGGQHVLGKDRCPFYHKMGACRHGDRCTKVHDKPTSSKTIILPMMYPNPKVVPLVVNRGGRAETMDYDRKLLKKHIEDFYEDVFCTVMEFGRVVEMRIVDNLCEHLLGNVYIKFENEVAAQNAVDGLTEKMYNGILLLPELCPVNDFADAICKEVEDATCKRAIQCNYWHPTPYPKPDSSLLRQLADAQDEKWSRYEKKRRSPQRRESSRSPPRRTEHRRESPPAANNNNNNNMVLCHVCGRLGHVGKKCPTLLAEKAAF